MHSLSKNCRSISVFFFKHQKVVRMTGRSVQRGSLILQTHGQKFSSPINTGRFIMYSGITKIYYRKTVGHIFAKPVQIEGTTQTFFSPVRSFSS
jgi:hypothetical protein